jgi:hypothetical protein
MLNPIKVEDLAKMSLAEIAEKMANARPGSEFDHISQAEFLRRQTEAAIETARFTRQNARYMLWSVVVLAVSAFATFVVTIFK